MNESQETTCTLCSGSCPVDFMALALSEGVIGYPTLPCMKKEGGPRLEPHCCRILFEKLRT